MSALSVDEFEKHLRSLCDRAYERPSSPDNPVMKLMQGELSIEEARQFWGGRWNRVLLLSQYVLPNLIRRCPHHDMRVELWPSVSVEYGGGDLAQSHPVLYRDFLTAIGIPEAECSFTLPADDPAIAREIDRLDGYDWLELLGRFLGRETVGPKVFPMIEEALAKAFGLDEHALAWFRVHGIQDQEDADDVFKVVRRYAITAEAQAKIEQAVQSWFDDSPEYCCAVGSMSYFYAAA
ncbi:MAG: iron-containing redox enzyme family protein [Proteobacteria bacterium]|nr:iron-containing redox enzyme family protein [Pseudomonadota bacterium]